MPPESDWPEDVSIPWNSFRIVPTTPLDQLVPNIEADACRFLKVSLISYNVNSFINDSAVLPTTYQMVAMSTHFD